MRVLCLLLASGLTLAAGASAAPSEDPPAFFFDLPVPGGQPTLDALEIAPEERAIALPLLARRFVGPSGAGASPAAPALAPQLFAVTGDGANAGAADEAVVVAAPLSERAWRALAPEHLHPSLLAFFLADRAALLVSGGAAAADGSLRALLDRDAALLRRIYRETPGAFVVAAGSLRLTDGRVDVPGGPGAHRIWADLVGTAPDQPAEFIAALLARDQGRLAWYFDTIANLDPARLEAAWAGAGTSVDARLESARALYAAFRDIDSSWRLEAHPFQRSAADPSLALQVLEVDGRRVRGPASMALWRALFGGSGMSRGEARAIAARKDDPAPLAWFVREIASAPLAERRDRLGMVALAQRAFGDATGPDVEHVAVALAGFRRFGALLLALDRIGVHQPATAAALVEAAGRIDASDRTALAMFQGAIALVERITLAGSLTPAAAVEVLAPLAHVAARSPGPATAAAWLTDTLAPALPPAPADSPPGLTGRLLAALAGRAGPAVLVEWEGLAFEVDRARSEQIRISSVHAQLRAPDLDSALASRRLDQAADALLALVYAPALGDPSGASFVTGDLPARHDFGFAARLPALRAQLAWQAPREMSGQGEPWRIQGSLFCIDLALARLSLRRVADGGMPGAPSLNLNDAHTLARTAVAMAAAPDLDDADRDALVAALARGRQRVAEAGHSAGRLVALAREARVSPAVREALPWAAMRAEIDPLALFSLRDLVWLGQPALAPARLDRWGVIGEPLDGRLRPVFAPPGPWEDAGGRPDSGSMAVRTPGLAIRLAEETARLGLPARLVPPLLLFAVQDVWHEAGQRFPDDGPALARAAAAMSAVRVEDYVASLTGTVLLRPR